MLIECGDIHKYSNNKVYTTIPDIDEGEYFLALMILMKDKESFLYIFPISLIVQQLTHIKMSRLTSVSYRSKK